MHRDEGITIPEAFKQTLQQAKRRPTALADWLRAQKHFLQWLSKRHPCATLWSDLTRSMLREYLGTYNAKAPNTQRLYLQPIRQTSGFMAREYSVPNIAERLGLGSKLRRPTPAVYLIDVLHFLEWLRLPKTDKPDSPLNNPDLEAAVALQALAGLRVQEMLRLTWNRVDLKKGLLEISGETKNDPSQRTIPLCSRVLEALLRAKDRQAASRPRGVQAIVGFVVLDKTGEPYADHRAYGRRLSRTIDKWNKKIGWVPKDLRNCLLSWSELEGIRSNSWEQYVGHAAGGVTEKHYLIPLATVSAGQNAELERRMGFLRTRVIEPLERGIREVWTDQEERKPQDLQNIATSGF